MKSAGGASSTISNEWFRTSGKRHDRAPPDTGRQPRSEVNDGLDQGREDMDERQVGRLGRRQDPHPLTSRTTPRACSKASARIASGATARRSSASMNTWI